MFHTAVPITHNRLCPVNTRPVGVRQMAYDVTGTYHILTQIHYGGICTVYVYAKDRRPPGLIIILSGVYECELSLIHISEPTRRA